MGLGFLFLIVLAFVLVRIFRRQPPDTSQPVAVQPAASAGSQPTPFLSLAEDSSRQFLIQGTRFSIGRAEGNSLHIDAGFPNYESVSRHHAAIYRQQGQYVIEDLNSYNGVWVGQQATSKSFLTDGAIVTLGDLNFVFHAGNSREQAGGNAI